MKARKAKNRRKSPRHYAWDLISAVIILGLVGAVAGGFFSSSGYVVSPGGQETKLIGIAQWVSSQEYAENIRGFKDGLAEHGYIEGNNALFIAENAEADRSRQREIVNSFIEKDVDLVYSLTTSGTLIVKDLIKDKPIVFSIITYPAETGLIGSLETSGNNLVGTRNYVSPELQYNAFEVLYHHTKKLAFARRKGELNSAIQYNEMKESLAREGIEVIDIAAIDLEDLRNQLSDVIADVDALYSSCDTLIQSGGEEVVIDFSLTHRVPSFTCNKDGVVKGALIGNVADFYTIGRMSGNKAGLIFDGADPSSLLTESPLRRHLAINTKTAAALGIGIPQHVLDDAEEIIQ